MKRLILVVIAIILLASVGWAGDERCIVYGVPFDCNVFMANQRQLTELEKNLKELERPQISSDFRLPPSDSEGIMLATQQQLIALEQKIKELERRIRELEERQVGKYGFSFDDARGIGVLNNCYTNLGR